MSGLNALIGVPNSPTVNEHLKNVFASDELEETSVIRNFRITAKDDKKYDAKHYNLDVILAVGYRVRSDRGTQFRKWRDDRAPTSGIALGDPPDRPYARNCLLFNFEHRTSNLVLRSHI